MWTTWRSLCSAGAALCLACGMADEPAHALEGAAVPASRFASSVRDVETRFVLDAALEDAARALAEPRCREVLDRFHDPVTGQPLRLRLAALAPDAPSFLRLLDFREGTTKAACRAGAMAVTGVGSHVVWVCPGAFATRGRSDRALAEAIVIHEMLHALGLGENPPGSVEITAEVRRHCAR
jgi:hypothetical protein